MAVKAAELTAPIPPQTAATTEVTSTPQRITVYMLGASTIPAPVDQPAPVPAPIQPPAPLSAATAHIGSISTSSKFPDASPTYSATRERVRRQLDELHARIMLERLKAKSLAPAVPLIDAPLIPLASRQPSPPTIVSPVETKPEERITPTPTPSPELTPPKNPRECPW